MFIVKYSFDENQTHFENNPNDILYTPIFYTIHSLRNSDIQLPVLGSSRSRLAIKLTIWLGRIKSIPNFIKIYGYP